MKYKAMCFAYLLPLLLLSCEDSEEHKASFNKKKPPPKPAVKTMTPLPVIVTPPQTKPKAKFPLFSDYQGEDWTQLTGVSGRSLFICFTTPWCPHSKAMRATLERFAQEENGRAQIVMVDPDKYPKLATKYKIEAIPYTLIFVEGMLLRQFRGALPMPDINTELYKALNVK